MAMLAILLAAVNLTVPASPYLKDKASGDWVMATPVLDADGWKCGDKFLKADPSGGIFVYSEEGLPRFRVTARVLPEFTYFTPIRGQRGKVEGNVYRRETDCRIQKSKSEKNVAVDAKYISTVEKLADGTVKMTFEATAGTNACEAINNQTVFAFAREFLDECQFAVDAKAHPNAENWLGATRIRFDDFSGKRLFSLAFDTNEVSGINFPYPRTCDIGFHRKSNKFSVILEPGETLVRKKPPVLTGGVDFVTESGVHIPEYRASANILMNPSFESGIRYWRSQIAHDIRNLVTDETARSGRRCLKLPGDGRIGVNVQSVGTILKSDTDYTFSCYVKNLPGRKEVNLDVHPRGMRGFASFLKQFRKHVKAPDWTRISYSFRTIADFHECCLWLTGSCYVDDIQLEEGTNVTEYVGNPYGLELVHDQPTCGYVDAKKPINLKLRVTGPVGAKGKLGVLGKDFFERQILRQAFDFNIPESGYQDIPLGPDTNWPLGTFVFTTKLVSTQTPPSYAKATEGKQTFSYTDYLRLSRIDARDGTDELRNLQGTPQFGSSKPDLNKPACHYEKLRDLGFGTLGYSGNQGFTYERLTPEDYDNLAKYGLSDLWGGVLWGVNWKRTLNGKPWKWEGQDIRALTNYPPAMLEWVENETYAMAKAIPQTKFYCFDTEPSGHYATTSKNRDFRSYAKLMLAVNRGLMRANPEITFVPYGSWNMIPHGGSDEIVNFLKICQELEPETHFKAMEIHTYRPLPEHPDVESDLCYFLNELDKIGYKDMKIKTGEGSYYYPIWRPSINLFAWTGVAGKDGYSHIGLPTYDLGWGERIGAALTMREEIVYLRHRDRVFSNVSWSPRAIDGHSPIAWTVAHCQLMSLLGKAKFLEDIRFAKECRAYAFDDQKGSTVAFVWRGNVRYDHGLAKPVEMTMANVKGLQILDLMGNECEVERRGSSFAKATEDRGGGERMTIPLSGFSVYLRVPNAKRGELFAALKNAKVARDEMLETLLPPEKTAEAAYVKNGKPDWTKVPVQHEDSLDWQVAWNEKTLWFRGVVPKRRLHSEGVELYFDGFGNARENFLDGEKAYDYDDFVYRLRPVDRQDERKTDAECFRVRAPDHQLTGGAGWGFVKDVVESNVVVTAQMTKWKPPETVYEAEFPLRYLMPIKLEKGTKIGIAAEMRPYHVYENHPVLFRSLKLKK